MLQPAKKRHDELYLLPDVRLAQVFDFTVADLDANRSGFLSWGQRYGVGRWAQRWFGHVLLAYARLTRWIDAAQNEKVVALCGRARLSYQVWVTRHTSEVCRLELMPHPVRFVITSAQYHALTEGMAYRVYYVPDMNGIFDQHILSIERPWQGCHGEASH